MLHHQIGTQLRFCSTAITRADAVSRRDLLRLASSPLRAAVRVTGGAGNMSKEEGEDVAILLADGLGGAACSASVLAGATMVINRPRRGRCMLCDRARMYCTSHQGAVTKHPGVMDILPRLAALNAPGKTVGVAPIVTPPFLWGGRFVISNESREPFYTVVDDQTPVCQLVQYSTDRPGLTWDDEWKVCLDYLDLLRNDADHRSLHLVYNGGVTTRNEVLHVAKLSNRSNPWRVLLIEDSGREATILANDTRWRNNHPNVVSCTKAELKTVVRELGFAPAA